MKGDNAYFNTRLNYLRASKKRLKNASVNNQSHLNGTLDTNENAVELSE